MADLEAGGKPMGIAHFYRITRRLGIEPKTRTRPALYPDDTAQRILIHFGLVDEPKPKRLATMGQLKKARASAKGAK